MTHDLRVAEYVLPGHPDQLCDVIADSLVQEAVERDRRAAVAVEVAVHRQMVLVTGRIACPGADTIDVAAVVRKAYEEAGYGPQWPPEPRRLKIRTDLRLDPLEPSEADQRGVADDQCIATGYAVDSPGTNYLPPEHWLAWRLSGRFRRLRHDQPDLRLGPDGKLLVGLRNEAERWRLTTFSASLQQAAEGDPVSLHRSVRDVLASELHEAARLLPDLDARPPDQIAVNGAGPFDVGGPMADNGLSGKKLAMNFYGPQVPIGGGALCGKDLYRPDRAAAILARRVAKAVVLTAAATECMATLFVTPGATEARIASLRDQDGRDLDIGRWGRLFDLRLAGIGDRYSGVEDLRLVAAEGHFTLADRLWERVGFDFSLRLGGSPRGGMAIDRPGHLAEGSTAGAGLDTLGGTAATDLGEANPRCTGVVPPHRGRFAGERRDSVRSPVGAS